MCISCATRLGFCIFVSWVACLMVTSLLFLMWSWRYCASIGGVLWSCSPTMMSVGWVIVDRFFVASNSSMSYMQSSTTCALVLCAPCSQ